MLRGVIRVLATLIASVVAVAAVAGVVLLLNAWQPNGDGRTALDLLSTRVNWVAVGSIVTAMATVVLALFAIRATRTASQAIRAVSEHTAASVAAGQAAVRAAEAASRSVEATAHGAEASARMADAGNRSIQAADRAIAENRRATALASTPVLSLSRPQPARGPGGLEIVLDVHANGPGVAINVTLNIEVQERDGAPYEPVPDASPAPAMLINAGETVAMRIPAQAFQNTLVTWVAPWPGGADPLPPPNLLVPVRMRFRLAWLSPAGARGQLACTWATSDIAHADPDGWRFEEFRIEPGAGDPLVVGP